MSQYQLIAGGHTLISLDGKSPKVKVVEGEIVDITNPEISRARLLMGGFKDEFEDGDEEVDLDTDGGDDEFADDEVDSDGKSTGKKSKGEGSGFNRDNYYFYKDKLVQLSGTIRPKEKSKEGKVLTLDFKTEEKIYTVVMDDMGKKLTTSCFQELLVTGLVSKITEKEYTISIKTYI